MNAEYLTDIVIKNDDPLAVPCNKYVPSESSSQALGV